MYSGTENVLNPEKPENMYKLKKGHPSGGALRMYCIDTEALVFMCNGGSPYGFTIHPIFTRICMLYTNHINNKKHVHHAFLAPQPYLCSTSLIIILDLVFRVRFAHVTDLTVCQHWVTGKFAILCLYKIAWTPSPSFYLVKNFTKILYVNFSKSTPQTPSLPPILYEYKIANLPELFISSLIGLLHIKGYRGAIIYYSPHLAFY